jgi:hypothetical protein
MNGFRRSDVSVALRLRGMTGTGVISLKVAGGRFVFDDNVLDGYGDIAFDDIAAIHCRVNDDSEPATGEYFS